MKGRADSVTLLQLLLHSVAPAHAAAPKAVISNGNLLFSNSFFMRRYGHGGHHPGKMFSPAKDVCGMPFHYLSATGESHDTYSKVEVGSKPGGGLTLSSKPRCSPGT